MINKIAGSESALLSAVQSLSFLDYAFEARCSRQRCAYLLSGDAVGQVLVCVFACGRIVICVCARAQALLINEFDGQTFEYHPVGFPFVLPLAGQTVLDQLGMHGRNFNEDCWMLGVMLVVWLTVTYLVLRFIVKERR